MNGRNSAGARNEEIEVLLIGMVFQFFLRWCAFVHSGIWEIWWQKSHHIVYIVPCSKQEAEFSTRTGFASAPPPSMWS